MAFDSSAPAGRLSAAHWRKTLAAYRGPQLSRSLAEIAWTLLPLTAFALAALFAFAVSGAAMADCVAGHKKVADQSTPVTVADGSQTKPAPGK